MKDNWKTLFFLLGRFKIWLTAVGIRQERLTGALMFCLNCLAVSGWFVFSCTPSLSAGDAWLIDARYASPQSGDASLERLVVNQLEQRESNRMQWAESTQNAFFDSYDPNIPLVVIIHGNWMTLPEAKSHGIAFHRLARKLGEHRLLVWSWPSERAMKKIRRDALLKARRADAHGHVLAMFLKKLPAGSKVSVVGFSFGAKLACEALQGLSDDVPRPQSMDMQVDTQPVDEKPIGHGLRVRTILLAAAMDQGSLAPGRQYGHALRGTEKMLIHVNPDDCVLRWYPKMKSCNGPAAIGREGVSYGRFPVEYIEKVRSRNVMRLIGHDHGFMDSLAALLACRGDFLHYALFE